MPKDGRVVEQGSAAEIVGAPREICAQTRAAAAFDMKARPNFSA